MTSKEEAKFLRKKLHDLRLTYRRQVRDLNRLLKIERLTNDLRWTKEQREFVKQELKGKEVRNGTIEQAGPGAEIRATISLPH